LLCFVRSAAANVIAALRRPRPEGARPRDSGCPHLPRERSVRRSTSRRPALRSVPESAPSPTVGFRRPSPPARRRRRPGTGNEAPCAAGGRGERGPASRARPSWPRGARRTRGKAPRERKEALRSARRTELRDGPAILRSDESRPWSSPPESPGTRTNDVRAEKPSGMVDCPPVACRSPARSCSVRSRA